jgi:hypothetical protein
VSERPVRARLRAYRAGVAVHSEGAREPDAASVREHLSRAEPDPRGLYPRAVRAAVFRTLWAAIAVLLAILGGMAVAYGDAVGW